MQSLNARVFLVQGAFCAMQCISVTYFVQAFQRFGYDNTLIGVIMMLTSIVLMLAQPLWGMVADKLPKTKRIVLCNCGATALLYFVFIYSGGARVPVIVAALGMYALFQPLMNLIDAWMSKLIVDGHPINYGASRTGGSIFYALTSLGFGIVVSRSGMKVAPWLFLVALAVMVLAVRGIPDAAPRRLGGKRLTLRESMRQLRHNRGYLVYVLAYFLMSLTVAPLNTYYPVVLYGLGGNEFHVGLAQFMQAAVEIPVMLSFNSLRRRTGWHPRVFLVVAMLAYSLKTLLVAWAPVLEVALAASLLQGVAFAVFLPASLAYVMETVDRDSLASAQMIAVAVGSSLAAIIMNPVGGAIADGLGVQSMLKWMVVFSTLAALLLALYTRRRNKQCAAPGK